MTHLFFKIWRCKYLDYLYFDIHSYKIYHLNTIAAYTSKKVEISGVVAWAILTLGAVRLLPIYLTASITEIIVYAVCCIFFVIYLRVSLGRALTYKKFLLLILWWSAAMTIINICYNELTTTPHHQPEIGPNAGLGILATIINIFFCSIVYVLIAQIPHRK